MRILVDPYFDVREIGDLLDLPEAEVVELPERMAGDDVVAVVPGTEYPVGALEIESLPALKLIVTPSIGFDHIDLEAIRGRRIWVYNVPDYCVEEMADSALALLLALLRGVVVLDRDVRAGGWDPRVAGPLRPVAATRLGIIGFGRIGRALARRALALDCEVWATDPFVRDDEIVGAGVHPVSLADLLASCNAFSLHAPLTPETNRLIGPTELSRMPRGAVLVNTARAGLLDTDALLDGLAAGHLAGAALDLVPVEPPTRAHPAPRASNLIVTPHAAYYSSDAEAKLTRRLTHILRAVLRGHPPDGALVKP